jgi:hypothetical protein
MFPRGKPPEQRAEIPREAEVAVAPRMPEGRVLLVVFLLLGLVPFDEEIVEFSAGVGEAGGVHGSWEIGAAVIACDALLCSRRGWSALARRAEC